MGADAISELTARVWSHVREAGWSHVREAGWSLVREAGWSHVREAGWSWVEMLSVQGCIEKGYVAKRCIVEGCIGK